MAVALESKISESETPVSTDASFDPYGRLLRMLMPTLRGIVVHDGFSNLVWASDDANLSEHPQIVNDAISNALGDTELFPGIVRTPDADSTVYSFALRAQGSELLGVVSLLVGLSSSQNEARSLQYVRQMVTPVLECMQRELSLRARLGSQEQALGVRERDLSLLLEMSSQQSATDSDADEFDLILKTGLEHMRCALAALWVPDKDICDVADAQRAAHGAGVPAAVRSST